MTLWNTHLMELVNLKWTHPVLDRVMASVSCLDAWVPMLGLAVVWALLAGGRKARWMLLYLAISLFISDSVVAHTLKHAVGEVRPRDAVNGVRICALGRAKIPSMRLFKPIEITFSKAKGHLNGNSFPSSHSMNMFAAATVVACFYRGWGVVLFLLAAVGSWSRVYCGAHWPSDLPPSMALGVATGVLSVWGIDHLRWKLGFL
jgi:undecaprenyl-diphosphatase